jgi:hypothetical protein
VIRSLSTDEYGVQPESHEIPIGWNTCGLVEPNGTVIKAQHLSLKEKKMETKHTPGPWRTIERDGSEGISIIGANGYTLGIVRRLVGLHAPQTEANTRLMRAAPALAEALRDMLELIDMTISPEQIKHLSEVEYAQARASLAQCEGRTE